MNLLVDRPGIVKVTVYNVSGEKVVSLLDGSKSQGAYRLTWDGRNQNGHVVGNGLYIIFVQTPAGQLSRKVIVLR